MIKKRQNFLFHAIIAITLVLLLSILFHVDYMNGPWYWKWPWQRIDNLPILKSLVIFGLFFVVQFLYYQKRLKISWALFWMLVSVVLSQIAICCIQNPELNILRIAKIIESPTATSYFTDALNIQSLREFLKNYCDLLPSLHLHSVHKPPGSILFYWILLVFFTPHTAALVGGICIGILSAFTIPATYLMIKTLTKDKDIAFNGASLMVLMPGFILIFPEFDQVFGIFTCLLVILWTQTLQKDKFIYSFLFGVVVTIMLFFTWNVLVLGLFLLMTTIHHLIRMKYRGWNNVLRHAMFSLLVVIGAYFLLWIFTGLDLLDVFAKCLFIVGIENGMIPRPYPDTILYDLTGFFLCAGWIPLVLGVAFLWRKLSLKEIDQTVWLSIFCFIQILFVAVSHLLSGETTRLWIFLLPLFLIPASFSLQIITFKERMLVFGCLWLLLGAIAQNMVFIRI